MLEPAAPELLASGGCVAQSAAPRRPDRPDRPAGPRPRPPRSSRHATRRPPGHRSPSPRRWESRSPRREMDTPPRLRRGRDARAPHCSGGRAGGCRVGPAKAARPSRRRRRRRAASARRARRCASTSTCRFFRGSSVATVKTYGAPSSARPPIGAERGVDAGRRYVHARRVEPERSDHIPTRVLGVDEHRVAVLRVSILRRVHRVGARRDPFAMMQRDEVVDHRRPKPAPLWREHPVGVVEDVDRAEKALDRWTAHTAPGLPPVMRERQEAQLRRQGNSGERLRDAAQARRAGRSKRDHLVAISRRRPPAPPSEPRM